LMHREFKKSKETREATIVGASRMRIVVPLDDATVAC
jgi:hypothetical protein